MASELHPQQVASTQPPDAQEPEEASKNEVVLRVLHPVSEFVHNVKGANPITAAGTAVPKGKVKQIKDLAEQNDVVVEEVK